MKKMILLLLLASASAQAGGYVQGYTRRDGTYVPGYYRSVPNANRFDNYSSRTYGGSQRDEFSSVPAYNQSNPAYNFGDNDNDGLSNGIDRTPENAYRW